LLLVATAAGCSSANKQNPAATAPPETFPSNYRNQVATLLMTLLNDPADFRTAMIAAPVLKQVGDNPHYIVCVQLNGHPPPREKVAVYLSGSITQFVDAQPGECAGAGYQPFTELARVNPSK
jgi:hypothetical protein